MDAVGVGVGVLGVLLGGGFGLDQLRRSREMGKQLDRLEAFLRARSPEPEAASQAILEQIEPNQPRTPVTAGEPTDMPKAVAAAIASLPEREKLVITLRYYEKLTLQE